MATKTKAKATKPAGPSEKELAAAKAKAEAEALIEKYTEVYRRSKLKSYGFIVKVDMSFSAPLYYVGTGVYSSNKEMFFINTNPFGTLPSAVDVGQMYAALNGKLEIKDMRTTSPHVSIVPIGDRAPFVPKKNETGSNVDDEIELMTRIFPTFKSVLPNKVLQKVSDEVLSSMITIYTFNFKPRIGDKAWRTDLPVLTLEDSPLKRSDKVFCGFRVLHLNVDGKEPIHQLAVMVGNSFTGSKNDEDLVPYTPCGVMFVNPNKAKVSRRFLNKMRPLIAAMKG